MRIKYPQTQKEASEAIGRYYNDTFAGELPLLSVNTEANIDLSEYNVSHIDYHEGSIVNVRGICFDYKYPDSELRTESVVIDVDKFLAAAEAIKAFHHYHKHLHHE